MFLTNFQTIFELKPKKKKTMLRHMLPGKTINYRTIACVQTSPISFEAKEIGDVCTQATERSLFRYTWVNIYPKGSKQENTFLIILQLCPSKYHHVHMVSCCRGDLKYDQGVKPRTIENGTTEGCLACYDAEAVYIFSNFNLTQTSRD